MVRSRQSGGLRRKAGRVLAGLTLLVVGLALVGAIYQAVATYVDERKYPPPGKMVDVGGCRLHIWCTGDGAPPVVIDSGAGGFSSVWSQVQPEIAKFTKACTYDRAGLGWSDPGPLPRTSQQIVVELHQLLTNAGVKGPYVLMGHSFGGFNVRLYAHQYPKEVAAMVLVDSSHPDQDLTAPDSRERAAKARREGEICSILARLGLVRLYLRLIEHGHPVGGLAKTLRGLVARLPADVQPEVWAMWSRPGFFNAAASEIASWSESAAEVRATGKLSDIPLVVLTRGRELNPLDPWLKFQNDLAALSSHSKHIIAAKSGHLILLDQPELVIDAVRQVVEDVRDRQHEIDR